MSGGALEIWIWWRNCRKLKGLLRSGIKEVFGVIDHRISSLESEVAGVEQKIDDGGLDEVAEARLNALRGQLHLWYSRKES